MSEMNVITTALKEVYGLFVEDGSYAVGILIWLFLSALVLPHIPALGQWRGPLVFTGMLALLAENVLRTARK